MKLFQKLTLPLAFVMAATPTFAKENAGPLHAENYTLQLQKDAVPVGNAYFNRMVAAGNAAKQGDCASMDTLMAENSKALDTSGISDPEKRAEEEYKVAFATSEVEPFIDQVWEYMVYSGCNGARRPDGTAKPLTQLPDSRL